MRALHTWPFAPLHRKRQWMSSSSSLAKNGLQCEFRLVPARADHIIECELAGPAHLC